MKKLGMDYPTAVREVARRVGITIPERGPTGPDPRGPLFGAVAAAAAWFARQLRESREADVARESLASRQLELDTVLPLGLGYAPRGKAFLDAMKGLGLRDEVLLEAGLGVKREGEEAPPVPRVRGPPLFPLPHPRARAVGLGGRPPRGGEAQDLHTPATPPFHK